MRHKKFLLYLSLLVALLLLGTIISCSSGGGGGGGGNGDPAAAQTASGATQATSVSNGAMSTFQNLGQVGLTSSIGAPHLKMPGSIRQDAGLGLAAKLSGKFAKSKAVTAAAAALKRARSLRSPAPWSGSDVCLDGGSFSYSGTYDSATGDYALSITFTSCRESGSQFDGVMSLTASGTSMTEKTYDPNISNSDLTILDYAGNYTTLTNKMTAHLTLGINVSTDSVTGAQTMAFSANGPLSTHDYYSGNDYNMTFTSFSDSITISVPPSVSWTSATTGTFTESWTETGGSKSVSVAFTNFTLTVDFVTGADNTSISGTVAITYTPSNMCAGGSWTFTTITPVHYVYATDMTTAGHIKINNTINIVWNADGTITVSDSSGSTKYDGDYDLSQVCDFATLDDPAPSSSGSSGSSTGGITATLTWDSPNSDMDLHLVHLTTAPSGTVDTWYINGDTGVTTNSDWHLYFSTGPGGGCSSGNYIGTASVPLASLDIDDCEGYGPEHITIDTPLQTGYYLLFVNQWDMWGDTSSTVTVSLQVGDKLFTFPTHTFTNATSGDNYTVCSFTVDGSGNVTVNSSSAGVLFAPKPGMAKKL